MVINETLNCETLLNFEEAKPYMYTTANRIFVTVGVPIVLVVGIVGNVGFLIVLFRIKHMRNITNFYLANLSIADSCLLLMGALQYLWTYIHSPLDVNFVFATTLGCAVPNFLVYFCYFASVLLVTLIATERYLAICHPLEHHTITGKRRSFRLISVTWGIAVLMTGFAAPYGNPEIVCVDWPAEEPYIDYPMIVPVCRGTCDWCNRALYAIDPAQFIVAFLANTCMYGRIVTILSKRSIIADQNGSSSSATVRASRLMAENRDQVARMLVVNTVVFFVCLMPYCITNLDSLLTESTQDSQGFLSRKEKQILSWIAKLTTLLNSAANPYLYSVTNKRYRDAFLQAFTCSNKPRGNRRFSSYAYTPADTQGDTHGSIIGETKV
ncbi:thyrotropin-releasing hormone receptor-like [Amphiura filiformis]|uniref:thyrotropin-releasing hormone receptor-like n=1 Tax=Amphiura filiformis TaxID=82378 RepID=UPI003B20E030